MPDRSPLTVIFEPTFIQDGDARVIRGGITVIATSRVIIFIYSIGYRTIHYLCVSLTSSKYDPHSLHLSLENIRFNKAECE